MLALGRALMIDPQLLLLDEPSAGLAPIVVDAIFEKIKAINESGISMVMIEQNARRSLALSHYAYVLDMGRNRFSGPGRELLHDETVVDLYLGGRGRLASPAAEALGRGRLRGNETTPGETGREPRRAPARSCPSLSRLLEGYGKASIGSSFPPLYSKNW